MGFDFKEAQLGLAQAIFAAGDFSRNVLDQVKTRTNVRLNVNTDNVAGVKLPSFQIKGEDELDMDNAALLGLAGGGQAIHKAREAFIKFLRVLIDIASLQTQFVTLDRALKVTNRRVNALEFIVIPRILGIIAWIDRELDEEAREDFFRLKKVTDNKKKQKDTGDEDQNDNENKEEEKEETVLPQDEIFALDSDEEDVFV